MFSLRKLVMAAMMIGLVTSCGSSKKKEKVEAPKEAKPEGRKFQKDFVLIEASSAEKPTWIDMPYEVEGSKGKKKFRYFLDGSEGQSKRLCLRSAGARANARIAREIAQFIKNTYAEATQGGEDEDVSEYMQEQLAQEAQTFIVGAQTLRTYWEKRRYKMELGASQDETKYSCNALVKMPKKNLEKAIRNSTAKLLRSIQDPEVKQKTEKAISQVEEKFNSLEQPVQLDDEV